MELSVSPCERTHQWNSIAVDLPRKDGLRIKSDTGLKTEHSDAKCDTLVLIVTDVMNAACKITGSPSSGFIPALKSTREETAGMRQSGDRTGTISKVWLTSEITLPRLLATNLNEFKSVPPREG